MLYFDSSWLQDTERKRTGTSKDSGERTGTMVDTLEGKTTVLVSVKSGKGVKEL